MVARGHRSLLRRAASGLGVMGVALTGLACGVTPSPDTPATASRSADEPAPRADQARPKATDHAAPVAKPKDDGLPPAWLGQSTLSVDHGRGPRRALVTPGPDTAAWCADAGSAWTSPARGEADGR